MAFPVKTEFVKNTGKCVFTQRAINRKMKENFIFTIPKEKHIHRMKDGALYKLPLNEEEIIQVLKMHKWNVSDKNSLADLIELIRAVEKIHGVV